MISFTFETDGRLPCGQALGEAIQQVNDETGGVPAYYMVNCAHPTHFEHVVEWDAAWRDRICGLRANASAKSHAKLDEATELEDGQPTDLAARYAALRERLPRLNVLGDAAAQSWSGIAGIRRGGWHYALSLSREGESERRERRALQV